jgi:hypothetical protein
LKQVRKRLTYANVMSSLAVFLVLGGGAAVAANGLGKNSVGTPQIKRNAVKVGKLAPEAVKAGKLAKNAVPTNRLRDNAVSAEKIANGSILTDKIADGSVTSSKLAKEAVLADKLAKDSVLTDKILNDAVTNAKIAPDAVTTGKIAGNAVTQPKVATDAVGASQFKALTVVTANSPTVANGNSTGATATCPAGTQAISGGFDGGDGGTAWRVHRLIRSGNGWRAFGTNQTGVDSFLQAEAYCLVP